MSAPDEVIAKWETDSEVPVSVIEPAKQPHLCTCIWLHGLGNHGDTYRRDIPLWLAGTYSVGEKVDYKEDAMVTAARQVVRDHVRFVIPTSKAMPITMTKKNQRGWYDVVGTDTYPSRVQEPAAGILESIEFIHALIQRESTELMKHRAVSDVTAASKHVVLAGFSQGGTMTFMAGLTSPVQLAALVPMSGYCCNVPWLKKQTETGQNEKEASVCKCPNAAVRDSPHIHVMQGDVDPIVRPEWSQQTIDVVKSIFQTTSPSSDHDGLAVTIFPGVDHTVVRPMVDVLMMHCAKATE